MWAIRAKHTVCITASCKGFVWITAFLFGVVHILRGSGSSRVPPIILQSPIADKPPLQRLPFYDFSGHHRGGWHQGYLFWLQPATTPLDAYKSNTLGLPASIFSSQCFRRYSQELHFLNSLCVDRGVCCTLCVCVCVITDCPSGQSISQRTDMASNNAQVVWGFPKVGSTDLWENVTPAWVDFCIILSAKRDKKGGREGWGLSWTLSKLCRLPRWRVYIFFYQGLPARLLWQFSPLPTYKHGGSESVRETAQKTTQSDREKSAAPSCHLISATSWHSAFCSTFPILRGAGWFTQHISI